MAPLGTWPDPTDPKPPVKKDSLTEEGQEIVNDQEEQEDEW